MSDNSSSDELATINFIDWTIPLLGEEYKLVHLPEPDI